MCSLVMSLYSRDLPLITNKIIPYTYKFSRDVNFADDSNLGFLQF